MVTIAVDLEEWVGSPVIRPVGRHYSRKPASAFSDEAASLTARQAVFDHNLIRIAESVGGPELPVDFELPDGRSLYLDRGCVKIAEHARFIEALKNGPTGVVDSIWLRWKVVA